MRTSPFTGNSSLFHSCYASAKCLKTEIFCISAACFACPGGILLFRFFPIVCLFALLTALVFSDTCAHRVVTWETLPHGPTCLSIIEADPTYRLLGCILVLPLSSSSLVDCVASILTFLGPFEWRLCIPHGELGCPLSQFSFCITS